MRLRSMSSSRPEHHMVSQHRHGSTINKFNSRLPIRFSNLHQSRWVEGSQSREVARSMYSVCRRRPQAKTDRHFHQLAKASHHERVALGTNPWRCVSCNRTFAKRLLRNVCHLSIRRQGVQPSVGIALGSGSTIWLCSVDHRPFRRAHHAFDEADGDCRRATSPGA